jgi:hypothetical protein
MAKTYDQLTQQAEDIAKSSARSPKA